MIFLLLSVLASALIFIIFRGIKLFGARVFQTVVINYFVAFALGYFLIEDKSQIADVANKSWLPYGLLLGTLFISFFYLMAWATDRIGVALTSMSSKMALILPVFILVAIEPDERLTILKVVGLVLSLIGIYLGAAVKGQRTLSLALLGLPILLFVGNGLVDFFIAHAQNHHLHSPTDEQMFTITPFAVSFCIGFPLVIFRYFWFKEAITWRSLLAGIVLGVVNYFSIWLLVKALSESAWSQSTLLPINNIGVVVVSALLAWAIFKEKPTPKKAVGLVLSLVAIYLISL